MSRVITFSRSFPAYHPKKGTPTFFPEKLFNSLHRSSGIIFTNLYSISNLNPGKEKETAGFWETVQMNYDSLGFKGHTIRAGNTWKVGEKFSPRVWSGIPYKSKQITIAPDIEIKKIWRFKMNNGMCMIELEGKWSILLSEDIKAVAMQDGLSFIDFYEWFRNPDFTGQIICWDDSINY